MHKVIYLLVEANEEKEAWEKLEHLRYLICDDEKYYDYGTFFNEESPMSGSSRWGNLVPVATLNSDDGKQHLDRAFAVIKSQFIEALHEIKNHISDYTDQELYDGKITDVKSQIIENLKDKPKDAFHLYMFRYHARRLTDTERYGWLYKLEEQDNQKWIEGFENELEFNSHTENKDKNKLWIAPMDVHF